MERYVRRNTWSYIHHKTQKFIYIDRIKGRDIHRKTRKKIQGKKYKYGHTRSEIYTKTYKKIFMEEETE